MKFPLRSTVQIGRYVTAQRGNDRYPLVIMLEPTLGCNIACIGCGKIREYESNKARLTVEECLFAAEECPAPVISVCGGEPLIFKGIEDVVAGFVDLKRNVQLCTNALRLEDMLDRFEPDARLVAPGYQYSQIDPALTMTREEHEEKFRIIRDSARKSGYRWLASPIYQDFLTGDRQLPCAPWGSVTRNPYGWKGPCYLLTDGIFPTYQALLDGIEWEEYGPGNDARCEHCAIHSGFEPSAAYEAAGSLRETVRSAAWTLTG